MNDESSWWLAADVDAPGWVLLAAPEAVDTEPNEQAWLAQVTQEVEASWGADWGFGDAEPIKQALSWALHHRTGVSALEFAFVPPDIPILSRAIVHIGAADPIEDWVKAGFYVNSYDTAAMGPGVQCVRQEKISGSDEHLELTEADYVFTDAVNSVVVSVERTETEAFVAMLPGLSQLLDRLHAWRPNGEAFSSSPISGYSVEAEDLWGPRPKDDTVPK